jgi:hypothetical protein
MRRIYIVALALICLLLVASVFPFGLGASFNEYHSSSQLVTKSQDITFHWEKTLAHGDWDRIGVNYDPLGHFFISFHYSIDSSMDVPATLSATYPSSLEPNQSVLIETKLETTGDRIIEIRPAIYFGIDLNILGLKTIQATYGGQWTMTFNLNTKDVQQMLNKVWIGDFTGGELLSVAKNTMNLNGWMSLQQLQINDVGLGTLVVGTMKLDLFRAVLNALKTLFIPAPLSYLVDALDWLVSNFFKVSTGLFITPKISAYASSPVQSKSNFASVGTNLLSFENDLSPKNVQLSTTADAHETNAANEFLIDFNPISFSYLFDVGWQYYFELALGPWQHTWTFDICRGPCINWNSQQLQTSLEISPKMDEPLQATEPTVNDGMIAIDLQDKSGISEATLYYSLDRVSWNSTTVSSEPGTSYSQRPISSVSEDTVVYYYLKIFDGDGDPYCIGTANNCYNYTLKASLLSILQSPRSLTIVAVIIVFIAALTGVIVFRKRAKNKIPSPKVDQ